MANPFDIIFKDKSLKDKFNPRVYHLTDGDYESELDSHLHYGKGSFPLKELLGFVPDGAKVTNEAKMGSLSSLDEIRSDKEIIDILITSIHI
mgnify:CR=1 FL=1